MGHICVLFVLQDGVGVSDVMITCVGTDAGKYKQFPSVVKCCLVVFV